MKAQDRHFHCFACGMDYRVTGWTGPLHTLQDGVLMRCINDKGTSHPIYGEGRIAAGVVCGAPIGWVSRAYPRGDKGLVITTDWRNLTLHTVAPKSITESRDAAIAEAARLSARVDQIQAALDDAYRVIAALDPDGLRTELAALRLLHETPCPGLVHPWEEGQEGVQPCGGYLGHPGDCAPYWAPQSGWRVPA